jgi:hypothetical protein
MAAVIHRPLRTHLTAEDHQRLEREAAARGITVSQCMRDCLHEYFAFRAELATALDTPDEATKTPTGLIHSLLAQTEGRLVATLDALAAAVTRGQEDVRLVQAMLDRLAFLYLTHTPEVAMPQRDEAFASGTRRHATWRRASARLAQNHWVFGGLPVPPDGPDRGA